MDPTFAWEHVVVEVLTRAVAEAAKVVLGLPLAIDFAWEQLGLSTESLDVAGSSCRVYIGNLGKLRSSGWWQERLADLFCCW